MSSSTTSESQESKQTFPILHNVNSSRETLILIQNYVNSWSKGALFNFIMNGDSSLFLVIYSSNPDSFLRDQGCVHITVTPTVNLNTFSASLLSFNRRLLKQINFELFNSTILEILDFSELLGILRNGSFKACSGVSESQIQTNCKGEEMSDNYIFEHYNETLVKRSKKCSYVFESSSEFRCSFCSSAESLVSKSPHKLIDGSLGRRPRGRPKGTTTKRKSIPSQTEKQEEDKQSSLGRGNRIKILSSILKDSRVFENKRGRPSSSSSGPLECPDCNSTFDVIKDYRNHVHLHSNSFSCSFKDCHKRFKSSTDVEIHEKKHRGVEEEEEEEEEETENEKELTSISCSNSGKNLSPSLQLTVHKTSHPGEKAFKCHICSKTFARNTQLRIHIAVHTGERAFLCPECGSSFGSMSTLIDHRKRRHLEIRNYKCKSCSKDFFTRQELVVHYRIHTGEKPFMCSLCGKAFSRTHHLKRHLSNVHKHHQEQMEESRLKNNVTTILLSSGSPENTLEKNDSLSSCNQNVEYTLIETSLEEENSLHQVVDESAMRFIVVKEENGTTKLVEISQ